MTKISQATIITDLTPDTFVPVAQSNGMGGFIDGKVRLGDLAQLGAADLPPASGGAVTQVVVTVPTVALGYAEVIHADAAVTGASKITADLVPSLDVENDLESIADNDLRVWPVPEAGQIRFVFTGRGAFVGPFTINYQVAA